MKKTITLFTAMLIGFIVYAQTPYVYFPFDGGSLSNMSGGNELISGDGGLVSFTGNTASGVGDALHLNGSQYFLTNFQSDTNSTGFTFSYWMKREYYGGIGLLVGQLQRLQNDYIGTFNTAVFQDGRVKFEFYQSPTSSYGLFTADTVPLDWHFITFKWKSNGTDGMMYIYQNGVLTDSALAPGQIFAAGATQPLFVGALKTTTFGPGGQTISTSSAYLGNIDEIKYFNTALSDAEIMHEYNPTAGIGNNGANDISVVLFPNPVQEILNIQIQEPIRYAEIYDMLGQKVGLSQGNITSVDVSTLNAGVYSLKIKTKQGDVSRKFVKQ